MSKQTGLEQQSLYGTGLELLSLDDSLSDSVVKLVVGCIEHTIMIENDIDPDGHIYSETDPIIKKGWENLSSEEFEVVISSFYSFIIDVTSHIELYREIVAQNKADAENEESGDSNTCRTVGNTLVKLIGTEFSHMLVENEGLNNGN